MNRAVDQSALYNPCMKMGDFVSPPSPDVIFPSPLEGEGQGERGGKIPPSPRPSPVKGEGVLIILLLLAITWIGPPVRAEETVLVAAAANLSHTLEEIIARYEEHTGSKVRASYGSSGNLTQQILQGAPFQVFLPADRRSLDRLQEQYHPIIAREVLAHGRIGFFVPRDSSLAGQDLKSVLHALQNGKYRRLALANPETAPYGVAAMESLQMAGVWVLEEDKLLLGESVAQAMQFALSGGVDLGVVPLSFARLPEVAGKGEFLEIPDGWHQPLLQYRVLLVDTAPARSFYEFLNSPTTIEILKSHGYETQMTID